MKKLAEIAKYIVAAAMFGKYRVSHIEMALMN